MACVCGGSFTKSISFVSKTQVSLDSAYRRMSINFIFALMCTIDIGPLAYILCRHNPILFPLHNEVSRAFGQLWMKTNSSNERVHTAGERNVFSLSQDTHIPRSFYIQQLKRNNLTKDHLPNHFKIYAENKEKLYSWMLHLKRMQTSKTLSPTQPSPSAVGTSIDGTGFFLKREKRLKTDLEKATVSDVSSPSTGLTDLARRGKVRLAPQPFAELSQTLHRISKMKATPIPFGTEEENLIPNIDQLLKAYKLDDPAPKRQPPLPLSFFKQFLEMNELRECGIPPNAHSFIHYTLRSDQDDVG